MIQINLYLTFNGICAILCISINASHTNLPSHTLKSRLYTIKLIIGV